MKVTFEKNYTRRNLPVLVKFIAAFLFCTIGSAAFALLLASLLFYSEKDFSTFCIGLSFLAFIFIIFVLLPVVLYIVHASVDRWRDIDAEIALLRGAFESKEDVYKVMFLGVDCLTFRIDYGNLDPFGPSRVRLRMIYDDIEANCGTFDEWKEVVDLFSNPARFSKFLENEICWITGAHALRKRVQLEV